MHEKIHLILWKLDWNNGISRVDAAATTVLVAATTVTTIVVDVDNFGITTLLDEAIPPGRGRGGNPSNRGGNSSNTKRGGNSKNDQNFRRGGTK